MASFITASSVLTYMYFEVYTCIRHRSEYLDRVWKMLNIME